MLRMTLLSSCLVALSLAGGAARAQETKIIVDGSTTVGPITKAFAQYFMSKNLGVNVSVSESGSGYGAKSLINGTCHVAAMSRFMKDKEFQAAVAKGVMPVAHTVAIDGVAVVVHPSNRVDQLTLEQLQGIYEGRIRNWSEVGGANMPIVQIGREITSGTFEVFNEIVMNEKRIAGNTETVGSNGAMRSRVQSTPAALGYVGLGFLDRTIKTVKIDGITPNRQTVATGKYPIARPLYLFTNGYPKLGTPLHAFVTLYLTEKGQEIIEDKKFVPVTNY